jgi:peroxiredoxin
MLALGTEAPDFSLRDTKTGTTVKRPDFAGKPLLVMFLSNHCPFVKHVQAKLAEIGRAFGVRGLSIVAISSNDVETYPQDGPALMKAEAETAGYSFPYLFDETQAVAKAYAAACTPDFYLFDADHRLVYRGQLDGSRPGNNIPVTGEDLVRAIESTLAGKRPHEDQKPSLGCNIKWKAGSEPTYYSAR